MPSIFDVAKSLTDINTIMIVKDPKNFPTEATPSLILIGLEEWVNENYIKMFLEEVPTVKDKKLSFNTIKIFTWNKKKTAWVKMNNYSDCESIATFFYHPIKQTVPTKNSQGEKLDIYLAFDLLEITMSNWYGVILRNLPQNCSDESIKQFCDSYVRDGVKYCIYPILIKEIYCSIIVMNDLEDAENLCIALNGVEVSKGRKIKVNLHPQICKIRNNIEGSVFSSMFNKNGYIFEENMLQSGKVIKSDIPLPKIYPKNENKDKYYKKEEGEIKEDLNNKNKKQNKRDKKDKDKETDNNNKNHQINNGPSGSGEKAQNGKTSIINQSLLSLLNLSNDSKSEEPNQKKEGTSNQHLSTQNHKSLKLMDKMSHLLLQMKDLSQNHLKGQQPSTQKSVHISNSSSPKVEEKQEPHPPQQKEIGEVQSASPNKTELTNTLNTNSRTKDDECQISPTSPTDNLMQVDYDQSEINYYTYNMKDKLYYDNKKKPIDKFSLDKFDELLKIRKQKIESDLTREKEKKHYIPSSRPSSSRNQDHYKNSYNKKHSNHHYYPSKYYSKDSYRDSHYHHRERSRSRHKDTHSKSYRKRSKS